MEEQELKKIETIAVEAMDKAIDHLKKNLSKIRTGKANTALLEGIMVDYYGAPTPLNQVANVSVADSRTLSIQPWEKSIISDIEQAIIKANLGLAPANDGEIIRLTIPHLTEERRAELVKQAKGEGEDSKVGIRSARHDALEALKQAKKDGLPEDIEKRWEGKIQDLTNQYGNKVDEIVKQKSDEIMTV